MNLGILAVQGLVNSFGPVVMAFFALSAIPAFGVVGIWWSVSIGWFLADAVGVVYYGIKKKTFLFSCNDIPGFAEISFIFQEMIGTFFHPETVLSKQLTDGFLVVDNFFDILLELLYAIFINGGFQVDAVF